MAAGQQDASLFCFYIAPGMLVDAQRQPGSVWEPAVVSGMPGDEAGMWELVGRTGDSCWKELVKHDSIRPRPRVATPVAGTRGRRIASKSEPVPPATTSALSTNATEIRELNSDCDELEKRLAALEAKHAAAVADAAASADPLMNLVDIAANVTHGDLHADLKHHIATARSAGVRFLVTPSMTVAGQRGARQTLSLARAHHGTVLACAGVHPFWSAAVVGGEARVDGVDCGPAAIAELREVAADPEVRCVGECGLDFSKPPQEKGGYPSPEAQLRWFELQVSLAVELEKPLYLHERDAHVEFLGVLRPLHRAGLLPPCVIHAFTGTEAELSAYRAMDFHVGVTGHLLRKKNPMVEWLPKYVPLSRLLIETDSPYMGFKGCRKTELTENNQKHTYPNVPASLPGVLEAVARSYGLSTVEVAAATTENARRLFSI